ncbi:GNAT family N-acetyltransferase [Streptomyces sp. NPDC049813]|uniref:GNAT family N-acetyltransferase n=1 Tax=Streptomyces sp. NPDC049813 TaxID=3365597 RepID=UPI0037AC67FE
MILRSATAAELPRLQDIEVAAGAAFRPLGMDAVADDEPPALAELEAFRRAGHCWVAAAGDGTVLAYLIGLPVDGAFHVEQVTVDPAAARRGIGRALLAHAADRARAAGLAAPTLTTFADVPWNAPYYERLGFQRLTDRALTPGLRAVRAAEAAHGLDRWPRVCMRREL